MDLIKEIISKKEKKDQVKEIVEGIVAVEECCEKRISERCYLCLIL